MTSPTINAARLVNTDKLKQEIADALPVSQVAAQLCDVELIPSGHQQKGLCPIHGEDSPSFYVNDSKGVFHCFGCKRGGDSISLIREVHHIGFRDALVMLALEAGVDIAAYERPATPEEKQKDALRAWCESYLEARVPETSRVKTDTARNLGVVQPVLPSGLPDAFKGKDYLFKGTVLFPYRTAAGRLVGWKVRTADKKMFMTPNDFPLMDEPVVWGLNIARVYIEDGRLTVVEGEYGAAVLHDHGVRDVAAIGGSKWTDEQMQLLEDMKIREVVFLLDGDTAGSTAAESIAKRFWRHKINVRIAQAWPGSDPEDMVRSIGVETVQIAIANARGALEWLLYQEWAKQPRETLTEKLDFVKWVQTEYGDQLIGVQETLVLKEVAQWLGLPDADVLDFARANKTILQAPDSEKAVLGRCCRDQPYYVAIRKRIVMHDFYVLKHQRLWHTLEQMLADGLDFDLTTIKRRAENEGVDPEYVSQVAGTGDLNIGWHEDQVIDFSTRRLARADADHFREVIADLNVPANQLIGTLTHNVTSKALGRGSGAFRAIQEQVDEAMDKLHERMRNPDAVVGLDLGSQFPKLNRNLQGLQRRRLVLVSATSGRGKSTLTLEFATGLAVHQSIPTDFISLEMDADEILFKQCSHLTGIDSMKITAGDLQPDEAQRVERAMARIRNSPLRIYAPDGITPNEFLLYAREAVMERRTEVFVLDYAQMVGPDPETARLGRYEQLGHFAYLCKQKVCRGLDTTVICCAQLKRDAAGKEEPTPEDMGDSYELVRAADVILLLNENDNQQSEIWIGKNRQGPGSVLIPTVYDKPANTMYEREAGAAKVPDYAVI